MREIKRIMKKARYADLRIEISRTTSITLEDGDIRETVTGISWGLGVRVLNKSWGFASTSIPTREKIRKAFDQAWKFSRLEKNRVDFEGASEKGRIKVKVKKNPIDVDLEEKRRIVEEGYKGAGEIKVKSVTVDYWDCFEKKIFANSEGSYISSRLPYVFFGIRTVAKKGSQLQEAYERVGGVAGFEFIERADVAKIGLKAADRASRLLSAKNPPSGRFPVVMDPKLAGVFIHEAFGHAAEADHVILGESILSGKIGEKIASSLLTVYDDPLIENSYGYYKYDDEGSPAKKTVLVESGVLKNFLHSRETSPILSATTTSNARAESYTQLPLVRMSNTVIKEGSFTFRELIDMKEGIYAKGMRGGQVDTVRGEFQFSAEEAFLIKNGELSERLKNLCLSGRTMQVLRNVEGIGKDLSLGSIGECGKQNQVVPVAEYSPHLRVKEILVGAPDA